MILQSEHVHQGQSSIPKKDRVKLYFDAGKETQDYFENQLKQSQLRLRTRLKDHKLVLNGIEKFRQISERKVYSALQDSNADYLQFLLDNRKQRLGRELPFMEKAIWKKERKVIRDLNSESLNIETNLKSSDTIKKELEQQLEIMRTKNPEVQIAKEDRQTLKLKEQQKKQNYLQFRQKGYWKVPNQKSSSAVVFVKQMKQKKEKQRERYRNSLQQSQMQMKLRQQAKINEAKQLHQRQRDKLHENYNKQRQQRQKQKDQGKKMQENAGNLLLKYAQKKPAHVAYLEKQNRQQAAQQLQRQELLHSIKQSKRHQSLVELKQSLKQLEYYQVEHSRQMRKQKFKEREKQEEVHQKLQKLYKSNFYARAQEEDKMVLPDKRKSKHQQIMKMLVYSQRAQSQHSPKIDEALRRELLLQIQQQAKRQNKLQKVTATGQLVLFTKDELNPKPIGLAYLRELKEINKLFRKDKATSCHQPQGIKIKDKSLDKHVLYKVNRTISNWKNILEKEEISTPQKQMMLKNYFDLIEEETVRAVQDKRKSSLAKSIDIQRRVDHYEMQKAKAQLALLKSLK